MFCILFLFFLLLNFFEAIQLILSTFLLLQITNPAAATIDDLLGLRKRVLVDLGTILQNQLKDQLQNQSQNDEQQVQNKQESTQNETTQKTEKQQKQQENKDKAKTSSTNVLIMENFVGEMKQKGFKDYNDDTQFRTLMKNVIDLNSSLVVI